jgi:hypothetical protein
MYNHFFSTIISEVTTGFLFNINVQVQYMLPDFTCGVDYVIYGRAPDNHASFLYYWVNGGEIFFAHLLPSLLPVL